MNSIKLATLPPALKKMLAAFLITLSLAYGLGLGYVYFNTGMTYSGVTADFRGSDTEMKFEKPAGEMFQTVHNHMFGLSITFLLTGAIFFFSSMRRGLMKTLILTEPFLSIVLSFGSFFLIRYVSGWWTWLLMLSGFLMALSFLAQVTVSLYDLLLGKS